MSLIRYFHFNGLVSDFGPYFYVGKTSGKITFLVEKKEDGNVECNVIIEYICNSDGNYVLNVEDPNNLIQSCTIVSIEEGVYQGDFSINIVFNNNLYFLYFLIICYGQNDSIGCSSGDNINWEKYPKTSLSFIGFPS
jgi:hypothetical protein